MLVRILSLLFGIMFVFVGVAGFFPNFLVNDLLFGYFSVNTMHNAVHIVTGVVAILAVMSFNAAKMFFRAFGIIYGLVAFLGFWQSNPDAATTMTMHMNMADNLFHLAVAFFFILIGFSV